MSIGWLVIDCHGHNFENGALTIAGAHERIKSAINKVVVFTNYKIDSTHHMTATPVVFEFNPAAPKTAITGYVGSTHDNVVTAQVTSDDEITIALVPWA